MSAGPRALYKGFLLHQVLWIPFNAIFWPLYEGSQAFVERRCVAEGKPTPAWSVPLSALVFTLSFATMINFRDARRCSSAEL